MASKSTLGDALETEYQQEVEKTRACRADVIQLLSHDASTRRADLIRVLELRIQVIQSEISLDKLPMMLGT